MESVKIDQLEEATKPYNIRHRCLYFSKDIIQFISTCKFDRIDFSMFEQLLGSGTSSVQTWWRADLGVQKKMFRIHDNRPEICQ